MSTPQNCIILGLPILLAIIAIVRSRPNVTILQNEKYLSESGYLPAAGDNSRDLDEQTENLVLHLRYGVRDKDFRNSNRLKRYVIEGSLLNKRNLTYNIEEYPISLRRHEVDKEIHKAFSVWSEHTPLNFTRKYNGKVDFQISFVRRDHGDDDPFDGMGNTLAHTYFTIDGSKIHFDADERWTIGTTHGDNLFQAAVHEIGHALGLKHSNVESSVMAPFSPSYDPNFKLHEDDIDGIQYLYGNKSFQPTNLQPSLPQKPNQELCDDPKIDAIFKTADNQIYVFKCEKYYKLAGKLVVDGYPKLISDGWPGLPGNIDAAFAYKNDKTYFFKDTKYWQFTGSQMDDGYPKEISKGFPGIPDYLDTAMYSEKLDKIYFFKGKHYWQLDSTSSKKNINDIPSWIDIPNNLDAAFINKKGFTYFFKDDKFYKTHDTDIPGNKHHNPFITKAWWFGCYSLS